ncbi:unnamed protein product [Cuscuta campestris]|uniref:GRF-type domain-containing protein n=1 Tax=Cuscuta campestris TaxID=132261 RepID=A0A484L715_9ASTE|nr:unnamed protein product [Cuscuta campestris]VFQ81390.1 unnamed protein product [Cuscuta campestris]
MAQNSHSFTSYRRICEYGEWLDVPCCKCGKEMKLVTSWTDKNPGRRLWTCGGKGNHKCLYWEWLDPPICERAKKIIPGLLKNRNANQEEIKLLKRKTIVAPFISGFVVALVIVYVVNVLFM